MSIIPGVGTIEGPIPFSAIDRFARRAELHGNAFERFKTLIRALDGEYREAKGRAQKPKSPAEADDDKLSPADEARLAQKKAMLARDEMERAAPAAQG